MFFDNGHSIFKEFFVERGIFERGNVDLGIMFERIRLAFAVANQAVDFGLQDFQFKGFG